MMTRSWGSCRELKRLTSPGGAPSTNAETVSICDMMRIRCTVVANLCKKKYAGACVDARLITQEARSKHAVRVEGWLRRGETTRGAGKIKLLQAQARNRYFWLHTKCCEHHVHCNHMLPDELDITIHKSQSALMELYSARLNDLLSTRV